MYINEDKNCRCLSATKVRIARAIMDLHTNAEHLNGLMRKKFTRHKKKRAQKITRQEKRKRETPTSNFGLLSKRIAFPLLKPLLLMGRSSQAYVVPLSSSKYEPCTQRTGLVQTRESRCGCRHCNEQSICGDQIDTPHCGLTLASGMLSMLAHDKPTEE